MEELFCYNCLCYDAHEIVPTIGKCKRTKEIKGFRDTCDEHYDKLEWNHDK